MRNNTLYHLVGVFLLTFITYSCENREVHSNNEEDSSTETFKDMPVEGIETHFNRITVDGIEYLILERDRNNPHEGFGFMAFKANKLMDKQDSIMAYLSVQLDNQAQILALLKNTSREQEAALIQRKLQKQLDAMRRTTVE